MSKRRCPSDARVAISTARPATGTSLSVVRGWGVPVADATAGAGEFVACAVPLGGVPTGGANRSVSPVAVVGSEGVALPASAVSTSWASGARSLPRLNSTGWSCGEDALVDEAGAPSGSEPVRAGAISGVPFGPGSAASLPWKLDFATGVPPSRAGTEDATAAWTVGMGVAAAGTVGVGVVGVVLTALGIAGAGSAPDRTERASLAD